MNTHELTKPSQDASSEKKEKAAILLGVLESFRTTASEVAVKAWIHALRDFSAAEVRAVVPKVLERKGLPGNVGAVLLELCQANRENPDPEMDCRPYPSRVVRFPPHYLARITCADGTREDVKLGPYGGYGRKEQPGAGVFEWDGMGQDAVARRVWSP